MTKNNNNECDTKLCYDSAKRTRFYNGMLLTAEHLRAEQNYHREALKRVVRHLFGSGIVCGLGVQYDTTGGFCVTIEPGVAVDCCGNIIEVCKCIRVDLSKECKDRFGDCTSQTTPPASFTKYLVLRYKETDGDPEPVLSPANECAVPGEGTSCEASSTQEGYCIELWDKCPCPPPKLDNQSDLVSILQESGQVYRRPNQTAGQAGQGNPPPEPKDCLNIPLKCTPCECCNAAVGIATLIFNCEDKKFEEPKPEDRCDCRRHVLSTGLFNWILSHLERAQYDEAAALLKRVDPTMRSLIGGCLEFNDRGDRLRNLENEIKKRDADVAYLRDVRFKQVDEGLKKMVDVDFKNLRDVEVKQMVDAEIKNREDEIKKRDVEMKKIVDAEIKKREDDIKKRDVEIKKRDDDIKKLHDEVKKLTDDLSKQRKKYPI